MDSITQKNRLQGIILLLTALLFVIHPTLASANNFNSTLSGVNHTLPQFSLDFQGDTHERSPAENSEDSEEDEEEIEENHESKNKSGAKGSLSSYAGILKEDKHNYLPISRDRTTACVYSYNTPRYIFFQSLKLDC